MGGRLSAAEVLIVLGGAVVSEGWVHARGGRTMGRGGREVLPVKDERCRQDGVQDAKQMGR